MQKSEEPKWEWIACDGCGVVLPPDQIALVIVEEDLLEGGDAKHLCAHCLLYFLGDFIRKASRKY